MTMDLSIASIEDDLTDPMNSGAAPEEAINVKVCCRFRPLSRQELQVTGGGQNCVQFRSPSCVSVNRSMETEGGTFTFDRVFDPDCSQGEVYEYAAKPIIRGVMQGFNGTVFAYGQTASGKTYTMEGPDLYSERDMGVIPRMVDTLFEEAETAPEDIEYTIRISLVEIYNERIRDLMDLSKDHLKIKEDPRKGVFIAGVTERYINNKELIFEILKEGHANRTAAVTNMNEHSSRSHLILMLTATAKNGSDESVKEGSLRLVDLAGSEKVSKTGATGNRLVEAGSINRSLSALGNVINALTSPGGNAGDKKHIPYRDSRLTRVLQESLGGNSKTCIILTCSPSLANITETVSTLRFGQRAKAIKNVCHVNQRRSVEELTIMLEKSQGLVVKHRETLTRCKRIIKHLKDRCSQAGIEIGSGLETIALEASPSTAGSSMKGSPKAEGVPLGSMAPTPAAPEVKPEDTNVRELRDQIADQELENRGLREELEEQAAKFEELRSEVAAAQEAKACLEYQLQEANDAQNHLAREGDESRRELAVLRERLEVAESLRQQQNQEKEREGEGSSSGSPPSASKNGADSSGDGSTIARCVSGCQRTFSENKAPSLRLLVQELQTTKMLQAQRIDRLEQLLEQAGSNGSDGDTVDGLLSRQTDELERRIAELEGQLSQQILRHKEEEWMMKHKMMQLDKNLGQLTDLHQAKIAQNADLQKELYEKERATKRKDTRINQLQESLSESKSRYDKLLVQCHNMTNAMDILQKRFGGTQGFGRGSAMVPPTPVGNGSTRRIAANMVVPLGRQGGGGPPTINRSAAEPKDEIMAQ
ncbi:hypothetical protein FOZ63_034056 [Perkinsus olseni]|uniref:Kinesin-like protein n=1 Tax=Perkinsus olseni TaxID=32597 RepID=A0A7J6QYC5_PEROL|nr:hypothetical protein FOZ63_034056 [Perkinsus olseni]